MWFVFKNIKERATPYWLVVPSLATRIMKCCSTALFPFCMSSCQEVSLNFPERYLKVFFHHEETEA